MVMASIVDLKNYVKQLFVSQIFDRLMSTSFVHDPQSRFEFIFCVKELKTLL